jgi:hypothetical protein
MAGDGTQHLVSVACNRHRHAVIAVCEFDCQTLTQAVVCRGEKEDLQGELPDLAKAD